MKIKAKLWQVFQHTKSTILKLNHKLKVHDERKTRINTPITPINKTRFNKKHTTQKKL